MFHNYIARFNVIPIYFSSAVSSQTSRVSDQPRSQGLSSSRPLERERVGKMRDPGNEVGD